MTRHAEHYHCLVERDDEGRVTAIAVDAVDLEGQERSVRINGFRAGRIASSVHEIVKGAGVTGRVWTATRPFELDPVSGAQTELVLRAVHPLGRLDHVETVARGIAAMSREEASYWHAKSWTRGDLRALRVLTTEGSIK